MLTDTIEQKAAKFLLCLLLCINVGVFERILKSVSYSVVNRPYKLNSFYSQCKQLVKVGLMYVRFMCCKNQRYNVVLN